MDVRASHLNLNPIAEGYSRARSSTESLIDDALAGDLTAFHRLYRSHYRAVRGVILARVPVRDAEDLIQEVFATAYVKLATLRERHKFGPWLRSIARSRAASYLREIRSSTTIELRDDLGGEPAEHANIGDALALVGALHELSSGYREILLLRFVEGLTGLEIARETGMTKGSVRVKLCRGLRLLRGKLGCDVVAMSKPNEIE